MVRMGRYCKAYALSVVERFPRWRDSARGDLVHRHEGEEPYVFLQEDLTVTADVFAGEDIVFDAFSAEWEQFCKRDLQFEIPAEYLDDEAVPAAQAAVATVE